MSLPFHVVKFTILQIIPNFIILHGNLGQLCMETMNVYHFKDIFKI